jgi:hypothetical protein
MIRLTGGQFDPSGGVRGLADVKSLAEEFKGRTGFETGAAALTHFGTRSGSRAVRRAWGGYQKLVFGTINGFIDRTARTAMAGQALKNSDFNEKRWNALSDKAIEDAAKGMQGTEAQVALAREVDSMAGKYSKQSPELRSALMHWTPFLPWYLNAIKFVLWTLPKDHPYVSSILAATSTAAEDWRKENNLSIKGDDFDPFALADYVRYTPAGAFTDWAAGIGRMALPQFTGAAANLSMGVDWTGKKLRDPEGEKFSVSEKAARAGLSIAESQVPLVSVGGRLSGLTKRYVDKKDPADIPPWRERLAKEAPFNESLLKGSLQKLTGSDEKGLDVKPIKVKKVKPVKVKRVKVR